MCRTVPCFQLTSDMTDCHIVIRSSRIEDRKVQKQRSFSFFNQRLQADMLFSFVFQAVQVLNLNM